MASDVRNWEQVLQYLSSLITFKTRADGKGWRDAHENMPVYLQVSGIRGRLGRSNTAPACVAICPPLEPPTLFCSAWA
jgi:hypothetical protein